MLVAWMVLLVALFRYDGTRGQKVSAALWVPIFWFSVIGSRLPSQWLGVTGDQAQMMTEGNSFDRVVYVALIVLSLVILSARSFSWGKFFTRNVTLSMILVFSLLSVAWSEFPFVAFKRWFRDLGTYLAILVALTEPSGLDGIRMLLRRVCYLLIPLSITLIKYYPEMAKHYDWWTGEAFFIGVTTSKNMLGVLCLVSGLFFLWDTLERWSHREDPYRRRIIWVNVAFIAMTLWLLSKASSATSSVCLGLGALIILMAHTKTIKRHPAFLTVSIPIGILSYVLLQFVFGVNVIETVAVAVGRNPDLTGRTNIWSVVLDSGTNPLIGAGYESFWLGDRLQWVWDRAGKVNEAHNGFLEVYLTLGLVGLGMYCFFLFASYGTIARRINTWSFGSLSLALWTVLIFYNVTESALRGHLMWIAFLLGAISLAAPVVAQAEAPSPTHPAQEMRPRRWAGPVRQVYDTYPSAQRLSPSPRPAAAGLQTSKRPAWGVRGGHGNDG
jgi:O-antigen ligase